MNKGKEQGQETEQNHYQTPQNHFRTPTTNPENLLPDRSAGLKGPYGPFRNNTTLIRALATLLVISSIGSVYFYAFPSDSHVNGQAGADTTHLVESNSALGTPEIWYSMVVLMTIVALITVILFSIWTVRSSKNAWLLDAPHMTITPGWALGYHFIPLVCLWRPYVAMKEIWRASFGSARKISMILPLWWTFWLLWPILGTLYLMILAFDPSSAEQITIRKIELIDTAITIIINSLAVVLLFKITRAQNSRISQWRT